MVSPEFQNWKQKTKIILQKYGITCVDPAGTFSYATTGNRREDINTAKKLIKINEQNLLTCDIAIILLSKNHPSVGTPIELYLANINKIPNIVVFDDGKIPAYILGLADTIRYDMESAIEYIINFQKS